MELPATRIRSSPDDVVVDALECPASPIGHCYPGNMDRITVNPKQMGGVPCIRGLRIPVATVVGMIANGMAPDEIVTELPPPRPLRT